MFTGRRWSYALEDTNNATQLRASTRKMGGKSRGRGVPGGRELYLCVPVVNVLSGLRKRYVA